MTTAETITETLTPTHDAILQYGEYFLVTRLAMRNGKGIHTLEILRRIEEPVYGFGPDSRGAAECELEQVETFEQAFPDGGHAIAFGIAYLNGTN